MRSQVAQHRKGGRPLYIVPFTFLHIEHTTEEETMSAIRLTALVLTLVATNALFVTGDAWAQQKYTISRAPSSNTQYLQQHVIDVDDAPGHQVRVFELRFDYPNKDLAFGGVTVKVALARGLTDYVNFSGPFTFYTVYTLEDGNKVFSRAAGTSLLTTGADGNRVIKFSGVENFVGGTARFKGIRGQLLISGERATFAKSVILQSSGEYWIED